MVWKNASVWENYGALFFWNSEEFNAAGRSKSHRIFFSLTPGNKKLKRLRTTNPEEINDMEVKRADLQASYAIKVAADKIMVAANLIINCMKELRSQFNTLANKNYREIQMSANAVKQLVIKVLDFERNQIFSFVSNCLSLNKNHYFLWKNWRFYQSSVSIYDALCKILSPLDCGDIKIGCDITNCEKFSTEWFLYYWFRWAKTKEKIWQLWRALAVK